MIKKIVIVGGGFAGWYTSLSLHKHFPELEITLVESPNIPRLRVGESLGFDSVYAWKRHLGLDNDVDLMRQTGSIYKYGVYNENFYQDNESIGHAKVFNLKVNALTSFYNQYEYPDYYEHWSKKPGDLGILNAWVYLNRLSNKSPHEFFDQVSDSSLFCSSTSMPYDSNNKFILRNNDGYSYHIDAEEMVSFLKSLMLSKDNNGLFNHILSNVVDVVQDEHGNISSVLLDTEQSVAGDIYIDCSGFGRILAKKTHQSTWKDYTEHNNSAWVCPTRYLDPEAELTCATKIYGEDYGWRFKVSLYHRQGNGYIYSDQLVDNSVIGNYLDRLTHGRQIKPPKLIKWKPGMYTKGWAKNCITLGVASGFFDPWDAPTFSEHNRDLETFIELVNKYNLGQMSESGCKEKYNTLRTLNLKERLLRITLSHGLSQRSGPYWDIARSRAQEQNIKSIYEQLLLDPDFEINKRMPFYWQQFYVKVLALTNTDTSQWKFDTPKAEDLELAKSFFIYTQARNRYIRQQDWPNAYRWLQVNRFNGATSQEMLEEFDRRN